MGKSKKASKEDKNKSKDDSTLVKESDDRPEYEVLITQVNAIAKPLATKKLTKKLYKTVKKGAKTKHVRRGVKEVVKALRKDEKGIVIIAGDISPIDVIAHVPILCEEKGLPYVYVPAKIDLGLSSMTKRPTSVVLVKPNKDYQDSYDECKSSIMTLPTTV